MIAAFSKSNLSFFSFASILESSRLDYVLFIVYYFVKLSIVEKFVKCVGDILVFFIVVDIGQLRLCVRIGCVLFILVEPYFAVIVVAILVERKQGNIIFLSTVRMVITAQLTICPSSSSSSTVISSSSYPFVFLSVINLRTIPFIL